MRKPLPITFPVGGISESQAISDQAENTTPVALNVRAFDQLDKRNRGGQRTGLAKFQAAQMNGTNDVQLISTMTEAVALSEDAGFLDKYANPSTLPTNTGHGIVFHPDGDVVVVYVRVSTTNYRLVSYNFSEASGFGAQIQDLSVANGTGTDIGGTRFAFDSTGAFLLVYSDGVSAGNHRIYPFSKITGAGTAVAFPSFASIANATGWTTADWHPDDDIVFIGFNAVTTNFASVRAYSWDGSAFTLLHAVSHASLTKAVFGVSSNPAGTAVVVSAASRIMSWEFDRDTGFSNGIDIASTTLTGDPAFSPDGETVAVIAGASFNTVDVRSYSPATGFGSADNIAPRFGHYPDGTVLSQRRVHRFWHGQYAIHQGVSLDRHMGRSP